jgi:hypothetical protein
MGVKMAEAMAKPGDMLLAGLRGCLVGLCWPRGRQ